MSAVTCAHSSTHALVMVEGGFGQCVAAVAAAKDAVVGQRRSSARRSVRWKSVFSALSVHLDRVQRYCTCVSNLASHTTQDEASTPRSQVKSPPCLLKVLPLAHGGDESAWYCGGAASNRHGRRGAASNRHGRRGAASNRHGRGSDCGIDCSTERSSDCSSAASSAWHRTSTTRSRRACSP